MNQHSGSRFHQTSLKVELKASCDGAAGSSCDDSILYETFNLMKAARTAGKVKSVGRCIGSLLLLISGQDWGRGRERKGGRIGGRVERRGRVRFHLLVKILSGTFLASGFQFMAQLISWFWSFD